MKYRVLGLALCLAACSERQTSNELEAQVPEAQEAVGATEAAELPASPSPEGMSHVWTRSGFKAPEGVARARNGEVFISNVNGGGTDEDGNGFVSKLNADGSIAVLEWASGMDGPKGMAVLDDRLYVADIDRVHLVDVETGAAIDTIELADAQFLNDVTVWQGDVYVSDSRKAAIYRIREASPEVWLEAPDALGGVNGLLGDGERLLITTMEAGALFSADVNGNLTLIADTMLNADGVGLHPDGGYLVSSWPGEIFHVSEDGAVTGLLDTREAGILQNDLTVFGDLVIVPNWEPGTVIAWRVD